MWENEHHEFADAIKLKDPRAAAVTYRKVKTTLRDLHIFDELIDGASSTTNKLAKMTRMCIHLFGFPSTSQLDRALEIGLTPFARACRGMRSLPDFVVIHSRWNLYKRMGCPPVSYDAVKRAVERHGFTRCVDKAWSTHDHSVDAVSDGNVKLVKYMVVSGRFQPHDCDRYLDLFDHGASPGTAMWEALGYEKSDEFMYYAYTNKVHKAGALAKYARGDYVIKYGMIAHSVWIASVDFEHTKIFRMLLRAAANVPGYNWNDDFELVLRDGTQRQVDVFQRVVFTR